MINYVVNFILFIVLLRYLYRNKVAPLLTQYSGEVKKHLEKASLDLARAQENLAILNNRLKDIEAESQELIDQYVTEGRRMSETVQEQADLAVTRSAADTKRQIEMEFNQTRKELRRQAVKLASDLARRKMEQGLGTDEDRRLRSQALREALFAESASRN